MAFRTQQYQDVISSLRRAETTLDALLTLASPLSPAAFEAMLEACPQGDVRHDAGETDSLCAITCDYFPGMRVFTCDDADALEGL